MLVNKNFAFAGCLALSALAMTGCGGGGGDNNAGNPNNPGGDPGTGDISVGGQEITAEEFALLTQTGTWRVIDGVDFEFSLSQDGFTNESAIEGNFSTTIAVTHNSNTDILVEECSDFETEVNDDPELEEDDIFDEDDFSDGEGNPICESQEVKYFKVGDNGFRVDVMCDDDRMAFMSAAKLKNEANLGFGSLNFTSNQISGHSNNSSACASISNFEHESTFTIPGEEPQSVEVSETDIAIAAPYQGGKIVFEFNLIDDLRSGTFNVVDGFPQEDDEVEVGVFSPVFGGSATDPDGVFGTSGTVTIDSISQTAVKGSFNFLTNSGDTMTGSFNVSF